MSSNPNYEIPTEIRIDRRNTTNTEIIDTSKFNQFLDFVFDSFGFKLVVYTVFFGITLVPLGAIVIGLIYFSHSDCPADDALSPSLIVTGLLAVIVSSLDLLILKRREKIRNQRQETIDNPGRETHNFADFEDDADSLASDDDEEPQSSYHQVIQKKKNTQRLVKTSNVLKFLEFAVFLYACSIVYRLYPSVQLEPAITAELSPGESTMIGAYCNKILYLYAFWSFTSTFILLGLVILSLCLVGFLAS